MHIFILLQCFYYALLPLFLFFEVQSMICFFIVQFLQFQILLQSFFKDTFYPVVYVYCCWVLYVIYFFLKRQSTNASDQVMSILMHQEVRISIIFCPTFWQNPNIYSNKRLFLFGAWYYFIIYCPVYMCRIRQAVVGFSLKVVPRNIPDTQITYLFQHKATFYGIFRSSGFIYVISIIIWFIKKELINLIISIKYIQYCQYLNCMEGQSKPTRKRAGFIRTNSSKAIASLKRTCSKEQIDDFSSFQKQKRQNQQNISESDHFSPYNKKFQRSTLVKPPLPHNKSIESHRKNNNFIRSNEKLQRERSSGSITNSCNVNSDLKQRSHNRENKSKERQEIEQNLAQAKKICEKIHKMRLSSSNEKYQKIESEFKSSPKHFNFEENHKKTKPKFNFNFQYSENQNIINEPKFGKETYKQEITIPKNYQFSQSSLSAYDEEEQSSYQMETFQEMRKPIFKTSSKQKSGSKEKERQKESTKILKAQNNSARKRFLSNYNEQSDHSQEQEYETYMNKHNYQYKEEQEQEEEELIQEHHVDDFKTTLKECVEFQNEKKRLENSGVYKAKGGICFEFDVNEFAKPIKEVEKQPKPVKKPKKLNTKQEIIKRRQMAKNYDKSARMRVFANY